LAALQRLVASYTQQHFIESLMTCSKLDIRVDTEDLLSTGLYWRITALEEYVQWADSYSNTHAQHQWVSCMLIKPWII